MNTRRLLTSALLAIGLAGGFVLDHTGSWRVGYFVTRKHDDTVGRSQDVHIPPIKRSGSKV